MGQTMVQVIQQQQLMEQQQIQQQWQQQQQPQPAGTAAEEAHSSASEKDQLNARGFEHIDVLTGGEENWLNWSWNSRVRNVQRREEMKTAEAKEGSRGHRCGGSGSNDVHESSDLHTMLAETRS